MTRRIHASLDGNTLTEAGGKSTTRHADIFHITWQLHFHGLVQLPIAIRLTIRDALSLVIDVLDVVRYLYRRSNTHRRCRRVETKN
jgi:hypothetical protein